MDKNEHKDGSGQLITRYLTQMIHAAVLVTSRHQGHVPDGLEVRPLPAVPRHADQVLSAVLVLKTPLQLGLAETDADTEVNDDEVTMLQMCL